ncbi:hypothetical protein GC177_09150 [bacterium]|nr:hypothetical protein [bacterium]
MASSYYFPKKSRQAETKTGFQFAEVSQDYDVKKPGFRATLYFDPSDTQAIEKVRGLVTAHEGLEMIADQVFEETEFSLDPETGKRIESKVPQQLFHLKGKGYFHQISGQLQGDGALPELKEEATLERGLREFRDSMDPMKLRGWLGQVSQVHSVLSGMERGNHNILNSALNSTVWNLPLLAVGGARRFDQGAMKKFKEDLVNYYHLEGQTADAVRSYDREQNVGDFIKRNSQVMTDIGKMPGDIMTIAAGAQEVRTAMKGHEEGKGAHVFSGSSLFMNGVLSFMSKFFTTVTLRKDDRERYFQENKDVANRIHEDSELRDIIERLKEKQQPWERTSGHKPYGIALENFMDRFGVGEQFSPRTNFGRFMYKLLDRFDLRNLTDLVKHVGVWDALRINGQVISGALDIVSNTVFRMFASFSTEFKDGKKGFDFNMFMSSVWINISRVLQIQADSNVTDFDIDQAAQLNARILVGKGIADDEKAIFDTATMLRGYVTNYEHQKIYTIEKLCDIIREEAHKLVPDQLLTQTTLEHQPELQPSRA